MTVNTSHLHTEAVPIDRLRPYPGNPRRGDLEAIRESLRENGQYRPIVVNRSTSEVLVGNHTLKAARQLGWKEIAVTYVDADEARARRIVLADNRTSDLAGYDSAALADLLQELPELSGTGYDEDDLDALLSELGRAERGEDDPPPPPAAPTTRRGDVYELGRHRLVCGDARDPASYGALLGAERADVLWTDPPFGVAYEGKTQARLRIAGDTRDGVRELLGESFARSEAALREGAALYVCHPSGAAALPFLESFLAQGWSLRQTLVWVKDAFVLGRSDYQWRHEAILYGYAPAAEPLGRGQKGWHGDDAQTSVLEFDRPRASRDHPTMKPPDLIERCLRNSSRPGAVVLDPFAGSGSTLVACERSGRAARLVELEPAYCDVVVARYERLTGQKARRVR